MIVAGTTGQDLEYEDFRFYKTGFATSARFDHQCRLMVTLLPTGSDTALNLPYSAQIMSALGSMDRLIIEDSHGCIH